MHVRDAGRPLQDRARAAKYMHVYTYMSMHVVVKTHLDNLCILSAPTEVHGNLSSLARFLVTVTTDGLVQFVRNGILLNLECVVRVQPAHGAGRLLPSLPAHAELSRTSLGWTHAHPILACRVAFTKDVPDK